MAAVDAAAVTVAAVTVAAAVVVAAVTVAAVTVAVVSVEAAGGLWAPATTMGHGVHAVMATTAVVGRLKMVPAPLGLVTVGDGVPQVQVMVRGVTAQISCLVEPAHAQSS